MSTIATLVLGIAAESFIGALVGNVTGDLYNKLKGDPPKKAYQLALGNAIRRYASEYREPLARPLLDKKGLLTDPEVNEELIKILRSDQIPNTQLIGTKWKAMINEPPKNQDLSKDAQLLVELLENELRNSDIYRSVFEAHDLHSIATDATISIESLENIEIQLDGLINILDSRLGFLINEFGRSSVSIRGQIRDYTYFIEEKTRNFIGRKWVFNAIKEFLAKNSRGYFYIIGDPGIGKTALAAQMVKQFGYVHHFNVKAEGINKASIFLQNICSQLIAAYNLPHPVIPPMATQDAGYMNKLLHEISRKLRHSERCVILVDALDEVDQLSKPEGANLLFLPLTLPKGIFFIVTLRPDKRILPRVECEQDEMLIKHDLANNLDDVRTFIRTASKTDEIKRYINSQSKGFQNFITALEDKSEGNFMYLRHVLADISRGAYQHLDLKHIPKGLQGYYEDHWKRLKGKDIDKWFEYKLPIIVGLTITQEPVSVNQISFLTKLKRAHINEVLEDWQQFIHVDVTEFDGRQISRYRFYHQSLIDFVSNKDQVKDERVDLQAMHERFADSMWEELYGRDKAA
jgi:hypothetical protein